MLFCSVKTNAAKRRYLRGSAGVALSYICFVFASRIAVDRWHPQGAHLLLVAALPTLSIICFAFLVGRYLREEPDEYQRDVVIRGMLWGTAAVLCTTVFAGFLRSYGLSGSLPPFTEFMLFWSVAGFSKIANNLADRKPAHDK